MGLNEIIKVGNTIKKYRKELNSTQEQMAAKLNIPRSTYANYENNTREPNAETLEKIAEILGINILDLIEDSNLYIYGSEDGLRLEKLLSFNEDLMSKIIQNMLHNNEISNINLLEGDYDLLIQSVKSTIKNTISILSSKNFDVLNHNLEIGKLNYEIAKLKHKK